MAEQTINVELLQRVKAHILEEPRRFDMGRWYDPEAGDDDEIPKDLRPPCGTVACIAGWALHLAGVNVEEMDGGYTSNAVRVLGVSKSQGFHLFYTANWPAEFDEAYNYADTPAQRAEVAAHRIEHFIATNGAE